MHAGQKLADIEAPDLDQQVSQARAALAQAQGQLGQAQATLEQLVATRDLAEITWQRYKVLTADGAVSRQDGDNQSTAAKTSAANVVAQQKTVRAMRGIRSRQPGDVGQIAGAARLRADHRAVCRRHHGAERRRWRPHLRYWLYILDRSAPMPPARLTFPAEAKYSVWRKSGGFVILVAVPQTNAPGVRVGQSRNGHRAADSQPEFSGKGDAHIRVLWTLNPGRC